LEDRQAVTQPQFSSDLRRIVKVVNEVAQLEEGELAGPEETVGEERQLHILWAIHCSRPLNRHEVGPPNVHGSKLWPRFLPQTDPSLWNRSRMGVEIQAFCVSQRRLDFRERGTGPEAPGAESNAGVQQGVGVVWFSRHNDSEPPDRHDRPVEIVRFEPLPIRVADKDQELDRIDSVGTHETSETTHHV
jgi:hypothetical protein